MFDTSVKRAHTRVSPARVLQLFFKKIFCLEIKLAIAALLESGLSVARSILNSSGARR